MGVHKGIERRRFHFEFRVARLLIAAQQGCLAGVFPFDDGSCDDVSADIGA
jgi:hypothetical protein